MSVLRFHRPAITRQAKVAVDQVVYFWGRALRVAKIHGDDPAAPVILEELGESAVALKGQLSLWSLDSLRRVGSGALKSPLKEEPNAKAQIRKPARENPSSRR